jgi:hypothetical protein
MADGGDDAPVTATPVVTSEVVSPAQLVAHVREMVPLLLGGSEGELSSVLSANTTLLARFGRMRVPHFAVVSRVSLFLLWAYSFIEEPQHMTLVIKRNILSKEEGWWVFSVFFGCFLGVFLFFGCVCVFVCLCG